MNNQQALRYFEWMGVNKLEKKMIEKNSSEETAERLGILTVTSDVASAIYCYASITSFSDRKKGIKLSPLRWSCYFLLVCLDYCVRKLKSIKNTLFCAVVADNFLS